MLIFPHNDSADRRSEMYNIPPGHSATKGNELGIIEFMGDVYSEEDLDMFFATFYPYDNLILQ